MKSKDFFTKLKTDGKVQAPEFASLIETIPDFEIHDKAVEAFEASFLTPDRAATDKSVHTKLKREILDPVDQELKPIIAFIDQHDRFASSEIDKMSSTYDKIKGIQKYFPAIVDKVKKAPEDEDTKKKLKTLEDSKNELLERIEKMNKDYSEKEKFFAAESEKKINGYRKRSELEKLANSFKFGKAYEEETARKKITKVTLDELESKHNLQLVDKDGQTSIQVTDKEGKPLFNGNSAITINQLLEEEFKPFIKTNNAGDDNNGDDSAGQDTKRFKVTDTQTKARLGTRTTVQ